MRLVEARNALDDALTAVETTDVVPRFALAVGVSEAASSQQRAELVALSTTLAKNAEDLEREITALEWERLRRAHGREQSLNDARIALALLPRLPAAKRDGVLGIGAEGIAQFRRELRHIGLQVRWYRLERVSAMRAQLDTFFRPAGG